MATRADPGGHKFVTSKTLSKLWLSGEVSTTSLQSFVNVAAYLINSNLPGFQILSNQLFSGPYRLSNTLQPLSGMVWAFFFVSLGGCRFEPDIHRTTGIDDDVFVFAAYAWELLVGLQSERLWLSYAKKDRSPWPGCSVADGSCRSWHLPAARPWSRWLVSTSTNGISDKNFTTQKLRKYAQGSSTPRRFRCYRPQ